MDKTQLFIPMILFEAVEREYRYSLYKSCQISALCGA